MHAHECDSEAQHCGLVSASVSALNVPRIRAKNVKLDLSLRQGLFESVTIFVRLSEGNGAGMQRVWLHFASSVDASKLWAHVVRLQWSSQPVDKSPTRPSAKWLKGSNDESKRTRYVGHIM